MADDGLREFERAGQKLRLAQNETIFSEGEAVDRAYKIVSGTVRLCKHLPDGRRQIAQFLFPGDYLSFIKLGDHSFSAEAVTDVLVISIPHSQVELLCSRNPELRNRLFGMLSARVRDIQNHLTMVGRQTAKERVASFLVMLLQRQGSRNGFVEVPMSRHDIADYLSLTTETVSRILSLFKSKQIIIGHVNSHRFEIKNFTALQALANCDR